MNQRVVCIRLPNWPIQRLQLARPELRNRPIVLDETRRGAARVVACSDAAARLGVGPGMTRAEASVLVDESALHAEPYDPAADRRMLESLAGECERFSPTVGVEEVDRPENLLLEIGSVSRLFGGEEIVARKIVDDFSGRGLEVHVAVGDTPGAAWAVAYGLEHGCHGHACVAMLGDREHMPTASVGMAPANIVPPGGAAEALAPLPLGALRLPADMLGVLAALGIDEIGQLMRLSRDALASRFGPELLCRLGQALGRVEEPIRTCRPTVAAAAEHGFDYPTAHRPALESHLRRLIARVAGELVARQEGVTRLRCEFVLEQGARRASARRGGSEGLLRIEVGLYQASVSAGDLFELAWMQVERRSFSSPVATLRVEAIGTAPLEYRQGELFAQGPRESTRRLARLIDRLTARLGRRAVLGARLVADAQPELAYRYEPLIDRRARASRAPWPCGRRQAPRPLLVAARPSPLEITRSSAGGMPLHFEEHHRMHRVVHLWGPERIETGWWRGRSVRRDYYRVETAEGRRLWVFRRLGDGKWFLHGRFQ
ncbi:MAG: DNA polymerase Y family protein [Pirellulales bacterium]|nr:DNA polymerase Y family protein [Pirellulales bacterium]